MMLARKLTMALAITVGVTALGTSPATAQVARSHGGHGPAGRCARVQTEIDRANAKTAKMTAKMTAKNARSADSANKHQAKFEARLAHLAEEIAKLQARCS